MELSDKAYRLYLLVSRTSFLDDADEVREAIYELAEYLYKEEELTINVPF